VREGTHRETGMGFLIWHNDISHTLATRIELVGLECSYFQGVCFGSRCRDFKGF